MSTLAFAIGGPELIILLLLLALGIGVTVVVVLIVLKIVNAKNKKTDE
ncbi:MAG: hypothetical protein ACKJSK_02935 [Roseibacillus sp.]|jgi:hypothetical protein